MHTKPKSDPTYSEEEKARPVTPTPAVDYSATPWWQIMVTADETVVITEPETVPE